MKKKPPTKTKLGVTPDQFRYKRNRLQQIKGFYHTVQQKSISKAAQKMGLTQAAITLQIQSLERDLGITLFNRNGRNLTLTEAGKIFYSQTSYHLHGIEDLFESFTKFISTKKSIIIDIAANHAVISYILPKFIKQFKDQHPTTKFKIRNLPKSECVKRLLDNEIDMFIYPMINNEIPDELDFFPIVKYQPILLIRKDHALANKKSFNLKDVAKFELVRIDPHLITLPAFEEIIKSHQLRSNIEFEMSDWEILKKFVKAEVGVAIISNIILEGEESGDLTGRILTDYFPEMTYGIFVKKGSVLQGMAKKFCNHLKSEKLLDAQHHN